MSDFDYEVMQRKNIAHSAKNRKCGSKSKKCSLPSDRMTNKQWKERCGEVMTYQFKPITWAEFKEMPRDLQQMYLNTLQDKYSVTGTRLTEMLGTTMMTFRKYCVANGLQPGFKCGRRMTTEEEKAFQAFANWEACDEVEIDAGDSLTTTEILQREDVHTWTNDEEIQNDRSAMAMTSFHLSFAGDFNRDMLANSLSCIIPKGTKVKIDIRCELME